MKDSIKTSVIWLNYILKGSLGQRRFLGVTPPSFRKQWIRDREKSEWLTFAVRDTDDWIQVEHIFLNEGFNLAASGRVPQMRRLYDSMVSKGEQPLIVDLGANIGLASAYFHRLYPEARILAVEPDASNCEIARKNLPANAKLFEAAISSKMGRASLENNNGRNCAFQVKPGEGNIEMITVPELLGGEPDVKPFIIKIDIEGFEEDLFSENLGWIDQFPIMLIELHDWMLPDRNVTKNFLKEHTKRDRHLMHFEGFVLTVDESLGTF